MNSYDLCLRMMRVLLPGAFSFALGSCWGAPGAPTEAMPALRFSVSDTATEDERRLVSELAIEAHGVLRSPAFRRNLAALEKRHPTVFVRRGEQDQPLAYVIEGVTGGWGPSRYPPVVIELVGVDDPDTEDYQRAGAGKPPLGIGSVPIRLGRGILADYRNADLVTRSCAVNTLAHELAHAVSSTPVIFTRAFEDTRRDDEVLVRGDPSSALASYLVGSVAQCTWLESKGRIQPWAVPECVDVFGYRAFNWRRCPAFPDTRKIQLDLDVPQPNEAL